MKTFRILAISDTHTMHKACEKFIPEGEYDMIIHSGDISGRGHEHEVEDFLDWFSGLKQFKYKLMIAGNHDFLFERKPERARKMIPDNVIYLEDEGIEIEGIKFWGSPQTPFFYNWAFNRQRGKGIKKYWDMIDPNTDVLVTHGPPHMVLDYVQHTHEYVGCEDLTYRVRQIIPAVHIFGHIHGSYGVKYLNGTMFYNASSVNEAYRPAHAAHLIELEIDEGGYVEVKTDDEYDY